MSSEVERRLEAMFAEAPEPDPGAGEEALHRALRSLQPVAAPRRGLRAAVLAFAVGVVLLVIAAGSLAAAGALRVSIGAKGKRPALMQLSLPQRASGIAVIVDGRLSVVTKGGFRLQGLPASAAALSPHALYVAAGIGNSLVALKPDGRQAWSRAAGGKVVAIAWAPDGLRIAYVVQPSGRHTNVLHVIWGNGIHDTVVGRGVYGLMPSWRADSLAFAYIGARGQAIVYDLAHATHRVIPVRGGALRLAYAPTGGELAINNVRRTMLVGESRKVVWRGGTKGIGWLDGQLVAADRIAGVPRSVLAFRTHGSLLAAAVAEGRSIRVLAGPVGHLRTVFEAPAKYHCARSPFLNACGLGIGDSDLQLG
jgi:hypothetical protein